MSNLEILLEYLFEKKQGDIFGQSFDDPRKKRPINDPPEKNTPEEQKLVNKLEKWFNGHLVASSLNNFANELNDLMPLIKSGKYPELTPPAGNVYRGMKITPEQLKNFLGLKEFNIKADEYKTINKSGILSPQKIKYYKAGKPISSWSTSPDAASEFSVTNPDVHRDEYLSVLFVANTENPFNKFFLNPDKLLYSYKKAITNYENEKEVIAVGPVKFDSVIVYSAFNIYGAKEHQNIDKVNKTIDKIIDTTVSELQQELIDQNSKIYKSAQILGIRATNEIPRVKERIHIDSYWSEPNIVSLSNAILAILQKNARAYKMNTVESPLNDIRYTLFKFYNNKTAYNVSPNSLTNPDDIKEFINLALKPALQQEQDAKYNRVNTSKLAYLAIPRREGRR